ncbi:MAG TPA: ATP-dependent DNA helicase RecG, partial [Acholeplasmataceae bacterium]|nr:ATP-dependent DNA helicase RecG [Acholeplasmataceae bacterium]
MNAIELLEIIGSGETSRVQFKKILDNQDGFAAEMIAMSNSKGGIILVGVQDKTGEIVGLDYPSLQDASNRIATIANELVKPLIYITTEVVIIDTKPYEKRVLIVYIEEGINKPYKDRNGTIWIKQGSDKRRVTDNNEIMRLFQQSGNLLADEMEVHGTSIDDINKDTFAEYFRKEFGETYEQKGLSYEEALRAKRVLRNNQVSLAGLLFFGNDPQSIKPAFTVKVVSFFGNDISENQYKSKPNDLKGTIPQLFNEAMNYLKSNLHHLQAGQNFNSVGILEISEIALIELVQNALIHRDYFKNSPVRILIF